MDVIRTPAQVRVRKELRYVPAKWMGTRTVRVVVSIGVISPGD